MLWIAAAAASLARYVELVGGAINHTVASPGTAVVDLQFRADGEEWHNKAGSFAKVGDWLLAFTSGDYQVRATVQSGTSPSGSPLNTWLDMDSNRTWTHTRSIVGVTQCSLLIEVRLKATQIVVESDTYTLRAEVAV